MLSRCFWAGQVTRRVAPERMRDTRLRGVYLQLSTELPLPIAQSLEKALFDYASSSDHNTSDPFRKRLDSRLRSPAPALP